MTANRPVTSGTRSLHPTSSEFLAFSAHAKRLGISLLPHQTERICTYINELLRWNKKINLTSTTDLKRILNEHVLDSLLPARHLGRVNALVDVGAGAGFPGIPIKILRPEISVVFIEARRKKASFLQHAIVMLGLADCEIFWGRGEDAAVKHRFEEKPAGAIITRAAVKDEIVLDMGDAFTRGRGRIFLMKGALPKMEREALEAQSRAQGKQILDVIGYRLPGMSKERNLVIIG